MRTAGAADPRREWLLELLQVGLERVDGRRCVRAALEERAAGGPGSPGGARVWAAAVGKAALGMARGAHDALGSALERVLVIAPDGAPGGDSDRPATFDILPGAHPLPDERSLAAGSRLIEWVDELPQAVQPLFLVSGGSSALVEVPEEGATLADLRALTQQSFTSGLPIGELNARRVALSRLKGGKLTARLRGRPACALFISDVPHDDPRVIGSGLLGPAAQGADHVARFVVACVDDAVQAIAHRAQQAGLAVHAPAGRFAGEATRLATRFAHELQLADAQLAVWGGESTVNLPEHPGRSGRNQHLALAAARLIAGQPDLMLLAAGTDGVDGLTPDAGALVDADTCARVALAELDPERCLRAADAARALAASGDLVHTGPTGTNVGDLVIALKLSAAAAQRLRPG